MSSSTDEQLQPERIIGNVYNYLRRLSSDPSSPPEVAAFFRQFRLATAEACGVRPETVDRIAERTAVTPIAVKEEEEEEEEEPSPSPEPILQNAQMPYMRPTLATQVDDLGADDLRRIVHEFYDRRESPNSTEVLNEFRKRSDYNGSRQSIVYNLKSLGFSFRKCEDGGSPVFLMERNDIVAARVRFLRTMDNLRKNKDPRPVFYMDKRWISENSAKFLGLDGPFGKMNRLMICYGGPNSFGFAVPESTLAVGCDSGSSQADHSQLDSTFFKNWIVLALKNLTEPSIIVTDSAPHRSILAETYTPTYPKSNETKANVRKWLAEEKVDFSPEETLSELHERALLVPRKKKYVLDRIALEMGHQVVRLPHRHCRYNPIEQVWTQVKNEVAPKLVSLDILVVEKHFYEALNAVTADAWKKCVTDCKKLYGEDYMKECFRDDILEPIVKTFKPDQDCDSEEVVDDLTYLLKVF